jgi:outer membrane lipoprotein LolB
VKRFFRLLVSALLASFFVAGCAVNTKAKAKSSLETAFWHGRLSMQVEAIPDDPQSSRHSFSAGFELSGAPESGELRLITPLGSTAAVLRWTAQDAVLEARGERRSYAGLDALTQDVLGASVPATALFAWLQGQPLAAPGWQPDLSEFAQGKINAIRAEPLPQARLRLVLEP